MPGNNPRFTLVASGVERTLRNSINISFRKMYEIPELKRQNEQDNDKTLAHALESEKKALHCTGSRTWSNPSAAKTFPQTSQHRQTT